MNSVGESLFIVQTGSPTVCVGELRQSDTRSVIGRRSILEGRIWEVLPYTTKVKAYCEVNLY